jgi:hypothetical protein
MGGTRRWAYAGVRLTPNRALERPGHRTAAVYEERRDQRGTSYEADTRLGPPVHYVLMRLGRGGMRR